jgi:hypothetical protein
LENNALLSLVVPTLRTATSWNFHAFCVSSPFVFLIQLSISTTMAHGPTLPRSLEHLADFYEVRILAGEAAVEHGEPKARAIFKRQRGFIHYWKRKVLLIYSTVLLVFIHT